MRGISVSDQEEPKAALLRDYRSNTKLIKPEY
jgi:hypothetical protein